MAYKHVISTKSWYQNDLFMFGGILMFWLMSNALFLNYGGNYIRTDRSSPTELSSSKVCLDDGPCVPPDIADSLNNVQFPSAIIFGARKCGTRALLEMLSAHPNIKTMKKEGHHFDRNDSYHLGKEWYRSQMPVTENAKEIVIEKTPSYISTAFAPSRLFSFNPNIKLIAMLRNPVDRLLSDYKQVEGLRAQKHLPPYPPFAEWIFMKDNTTIAMHRSVHVGKYSAQLVEWFKYFPPSQFIFLDGSKFIKDPVPALKNLEAFLKIPPHFNNKNVYFNETKGFFCWLRKGKPNCLGDNKGRTPPTISPEQRKIIHSYYKPYNEKLFSMIGETFDWTS